MKSRPPLNAARFPQVLRVVPQQLLDARVAGRRKVRKGVQHQRQPHPPGACRQGHILQIIERRAGGRAGNSNCRAARPPQHHQGKPPPIQVIEYYRETYHHSQHSPLCNFSIVIELGVCSLHDALKDGHYHYDLADVRRFLANLIDAGAYLESKELVHRDIKPGNIIIFGEHLAFKLADFGLSCKAH